MSKSENKKSAPPKTPVASKAENETGQNKATPRPWKLGMFADGIEEAPAGLTTEQRKRWDAIMAERNRPMRENDGSFIIVAGDGNKRRVATITSQVRAKRGTAHTAEDPEGLANAELICRAVNNHEELIAALQTLIDTYIANPGTDKLGAAFDKARRAIANAEKA